MLTDYIRARRPLWHYAQALKRGKLTVGFVGGSITEPSHGQRWSDKLVDDIIYTHPGLTVNVENAAKGATGSLSAIFRVDRDVLPYDCDIVFVETAVNDDPEARGACREGLIRKLLADGRFDVVLVYTYCYDFYKAFLNRELPDSIRDWEQLAERYQVPAVFSGLHAFDTLCDGYLRYEEWLPDGLHPQQAGSRVYAEPIARLLADNENAEPAAPVALPSPLYENHWGRSYILPWEKVTRVGPWRLTHCRRFPTVDYILYTASVRASLSFDFEGRGIVLRTNLNKLAAGCEWRVDGGEWKSTCDPLPDWGKNATDWVDEELLTDSLPDGVHHFELKVMFREGNVGTNFELCTIGVVR